MSRKRRVGAWAVGAIAICAAVTAWLWHASRPGPDLRLLRADPVASYVPSMVKLVSESTANSDFDGLLGKPEPAEVRRTFSGRGAGSVQIAKTDLLAFAARRGWDVRPAAGGGPVTATKPVSSGDPVKDRAVEPRAQLVVSAQEDELAVTLSLRPLSE